MMPCIFCGAPADSREDLFPRWILKRVVTRLPLYRQFGDSPPEITDDQEVRVPCVCQKCNNTWMSGMETTVKKFLGPMIGDFALTLDRQNQQNLAEWSLKCAMCNDAVDPHPRFFTEAECHTFKKTRTIPDRTLVFAARFTGSSLDSNGVDFTLIEPESDALLVRGHVYNVMVGHVVLQVLSWHPEPAHEKKDRSHESREWPVGSVDDPNLAARKEISELAAPVVFVYGRRRNSLRSLSEALQKRDRSSANYAEVMNAEFFQHARRACQESTWCREAIPHVSENDSCECLDFGRI